MPFTMENVYIVERTVVYPYRNIEQHTYTQTAHNKRDGKLFPNNNAFAFPFFNNSIKLLHIAERSINRDLIVYLICWQRLYYLEKSQHHYFIIIML